MSDSLYGSPVRSSPDQFEQVADSYDARYVDALEYRTSMRAIFDAYGETHSGPHIDVIVAAGDAVIEGLRTMVEGYYDIGWAFRYAAADLRALQAESSSGSTLHNLRADVRSQDADADTEKLMIDVQVEFDRIQAEEKRILRDLATKIEVAPRGQLADLNNAALEKVLATLVAGVDNLTDLRSLERAEVLLSDEGDGALDDGLLDLPIEIAVAIVRGEIEVDETDGTYDIDGLVDSVEAAVAGGQTPDEVGLDRRLFPPEYRDHPKERMRDADLHEVTTVVEVGDFYGHSDWKGRRLGEIHEERVEVAGSGELDGTSIVNGTSLSPVAAETLSEAVADDPAVSVAFFNHVGPELVGTVVLRPGGASSDQYVATVENYSEALAAASRSDGGRALNFGGDELIEKGGSLTTYLLDREDYDAAFYTSVTAAWLLANDGQSSGGGGLTAWDPTVDPDLRARSGSKPSNIVLRRSAERPGVASAVVIELAAEDPDLSVVFDPAYSFRPDDSDGGGGLPVAPFLVAAGTDTEAASLLLVKGAKVDEFPGPGVAAGMDGVMGHHATVMYEDEYLGSLGIDPDESGRLSQEELAALGFGSDDWNQLQENVGDHGYGVFLAAGNDTLLLEAKRNEFNGTSSGGDYTRLAYMSGGLYQQAYEYELAVAEQNDADAERRNQYAQTGIAVATALAVVSAGSIMPPATVAGELAWLAADLGSSVAVDWSTPEFWTTNNVDGVKDKNGAFNAYRDQKLAALGALAYLQTANEPVRISDREGNDYYVRVVEGSDGQFDVRWTNVNGDESAPPPKIDWERSDQKLWVARTETGVEFGDADHGGYVSAGGLTTEGQPQVANHEGAVEQIAGIGVVDEITRGKADPWLNL